MSNNQQESLVQHWTEKEEYAGKVVAVKTADLSKQDAMPIAAGDNEEDVREDVQSKGYALRDVTITYNPTL